MPQFFPVLLGTHIVLAVGLLLPAILLPFALRTRRAADESPNRMVRYLLWMLTQPWLLLALTIYAVNLVIAFFVARPNLRRLVGVRASADDRVWRDRAKRQRYVSYAMAALVGTIGFLMSTKPQLW
jgi:bacteriorhodopsin